MDTTSKDMGARLKRSLAQSEYITSAWNWFMILAGKAAEPVLVMSVLYASVKLLPIVHFPPQFDVVVFVAQFVALDVGGLSLNKLADQAKQDGNEEGATQAKRLSLALVAVMLIGVIMAGMGQIVKLDGQIGTVIDTLLVIARAVMAVLYSRVIHCLKKDEVGESSYSSGEDLVSQQINTVVQELRQQFEVSLSQRLTEVSARQDEALRQLRDEQTKALHETMDTLTDLIEAALQKYTVKRETRQSRPTERSSKVRSITDTPSRQRGTQEIDKVVWPLLNTGMTVRAIAAKANTSTATVGRSRQRWKAAQKNALSETDGETAEA
jgi:hypothetical protein